MSENFIAIKDLYVEYRTDLEVVKAVNGISFTVGKGETLGIVGETGAGKTTTALAILRLLPENTGRVTGGSIELEGRNMMELSPKEIREVRGQKISMIFQDPMTALNPVFTVGEQIGEAILFHHPETPKTEVEARVEEVLNLVGIDPKRKNDYPHQFSGGMKQRVVIAIALACEPDMIIADEPTTALDVTIQAQILAMMKDLRERINTSMIMITHDLGIVAQMCDKVAVMYAGQIIEFGSVEDIFSRERDHHPYTVGLFNSIPNLREKAARLKPIPGLMPDPTNLPAGCKFSPRCPHCMEICRSDDPAAIGEGEHKIKCHLFDGGGISRGE